jgi:hypothetical protein
MRGGVRKSMSGLVKSLSIYAVPRLYVLQRGYYICEPHCTHGMGMTFRMSGVLLLKVSNRYEKSLFLMKRKCRGIVTLWINGKG